MADELQAELERLREENAALKSGSATNLVKTSFTPARS